MAQYIQVQILKIPLMVYLNLSWIEWKYNGSMKYICLYPIWCVYIYIWIYTQLYHTTSTLGLSENSKLSKNVVLFFRQIRTVWICMDSMLGPLIIQWTPATSTRLAQGLHKVAIDHECVGTFRVMESIAVKHFKTHQVLRISVRLSSSWVTRYRWSNMAGKSPE